ncbi:MAG: hypothetical protein CL908_13440 [Deltaproteobacteria bacterium]|nr:hypothetical protein [Deltaproteobacteria bacterium]
MMTSLLCTHLSEKISADENRIPLLLATEESAHPQTLEPIGTRNHVASLHERPQASIVLPTAT